METKKCKRCYQEKPLTKEYFHSHPYTTDGFFGKCKICYNKERNVYNGTEHHLKSMKKTFNKLGGGVYEIVNLITGENYIGSSKTLQRRKYNHFTVCKNISQTNPFLQEAIKTYSPDAFEFFVIEKIDGTKTQLLEKEKYYINKFNPTYNKYK